MKTSTHVDAITAAISDPLLAVSYKMRHAILRCDAPAAVSFYLRAHPELSERLASKDNPGEDIAKIAKAFARIDARLRSAI